ncbi:MAG: hypothetical protein KDB07_07405, partial [Planctomycetes bacterium]|nr:hypothetical protein [Planctomycetota bacterium]
IFQSALRKYAGEEANIGASKSNMRPEDEDVKFRPMPGREGIASNEAAIAFTAQQSQMGPNSSVSALLSAPVPYTQESGRVGSPGKMDEFTGDKTSAAKFAQIRKRIRELGASSPSR